MKYKSIRRVSMPFFLVSSLAILCFGWISGWQVPARANDMALSTHNQVGISLPLQPIRSGLIFEKLKSSDRSAKAYYNRGTASYNKGNYDVALRYLSLSLGLEPKAADAYFNRGLSFRRLYKIDEAISDFSKAIELNHTQPGYYFERCNALIVKSDFNSAIIDCSDAIRLSPGEPEPYFLRGLAYRFKDDLGGAFEDSFKAVQIDPNYTDAKQLFFEVLLKMDTANPRGDSLTLYKSGLENLPRGVFSAEKT